MGGFRADGQRFSGDGGEVRKKQRVRRDGPGAREGVWQERARNECVLAFR